MSSVDFGKDIVREWVHENLCQGDSCLDVGACDGKWADILGDYLTMDGIEIFPQNVIAHQLWKKYRAITIGDARNFPFPGHDLIVFGDVLEHMTVEQAQKLVDKAKWNADNIIIGVPFQWKQDEMYGNPYEKHIQDDLTDEVFRNRFGGFKPLKVYSNYGYYVWRKNFSRF